MARCLAAIYDRYAGRCSASARTCCAARPTPRTACRTSSSSPRPASATLREPERLRSWLYSVARHECLARLDRRNREFLMDDVPDRASADSDQPATVAPSTTNSPRCCTT